MEVFAPAGVRVGRDVLATAQLRDTLLASKPLEHDADLLFGSELASRAPADLTNRRFGGLLLASCHLETLLGALGPVKCLLG